MIIDKRLPTVIMLGFKSLSGKDTFFSFAESLGFKRAAFADKLKNSVADLYNLSREQVHGSLKDIEDHRYKNFIDPSDIEEVVDLSDGKKMLVFNKNPEFKEYLTPRRILQIYGQDQRALYPDIWAAYVFNNTIPELIKQGYNKFIITDFRFRNEAAVAESWHKNTKSNLIFIKINRPQVEAKSSPSDISENDLNSFSKWDYIIDNDGSLEDYKMKVLSLLNNIFT